MELGGAKEPGLGTCIRDERICSAVWDNHLAPQAGLCTGGPAAVEEFALTDRIARKGLSEKTFMPRADAMEKEQRELSCLFFYLKYMTHNSCPAFHYSIQMALFSISFWSTAPVVPVPSHCSPSLHPGSLPGAHLCSTC
ncbi:hypothetical protein LEMLEM_LOCUS14352 [Lemmus lemmus]